MKCLLRQDNKTIVEVEFVKKINDTGCVVKHPVHGEISIPTNLLFEHVRSWLLDDLDFKPKEDCLYLVPGDIALDTLGGVGPFSIIKRTGETFARFKSKNKTIYMPYAVFTSLIVEEVKAVNVDNIKDVEEKDKVLWKFFIEDEIDSKGVVKCTLGFKGGLKTEGVSYITGDFNVACANAEHAAMHDYAAKKLKQKTKHTFKLKNQEELAVARKRFWDKFNKHIEYSLRSAGLLQ